MCGAFISTITTHSLTSLQTGTTYQPCGKYCFENINRFSARREKFMSSSSNHSDSETVKIHTYHIFAKRSENNIMTCRKIKVPQVTHGTPYHSLSSSIAPLTSCGKAMPSPKVELANTMSKPKQSFGKISMLHPFLSSFPSTTN